MMPSTPSPDSARVRATVLAVEFVPAPTIRGILPAQRANRAAGERLDLLERQRGRLPGGAGDHDAVGAFRQVKIEQPIHEARSRLPSTLIGVTMATRLPRIKAPGEKYRYHNSETALWQAPSGRICVDETTYCN